MVLDTRYAYFGQHPFPSRLVAGFDTAGIGEERWALNIAEYLVKQGVEVYVHPSKGEWLDPETPCPSNFHRGIPPSDDVICFSESFIPIGIPHRLSIYLMWEPSANKLKFPFTGTHVAVYSYPAGVRTGGLLNRLNGQNVQFLPYLVDIDSELDGSDRKNIFWTSKGGFNTHSGPPALPRAAMEWVRDKMNADPELTFTMTGATHGLPPPQALDAIRRHPAFGLVSGMKERVVISGGMSYARLKRVLKTTKIVLNPGHFGHTYGGSSVEAACSGIPTPQLPDGPFIELGERILFRYGRETLQDYLAHLERLMVDKKYYDLKAKAYFDYAKQVYGAENWCKRLRAIFAQHGRK